MSNKDNSFLEEKNRNPEAEFRELSSWLAFPSNWLCDLVAIHIIFVLQFPHL